MRWMLGLTLWLSTIGLAAAQMAQLPAPKPGQAVATFAGGCFWCVEADFDKVDGVISTTSGYIGGKTANPTYHQVSAGTTGHTEAVQIVYEPGKVTYEKLLEVFWRNHDPLTKDRQFCDRGAHYRAGVFYHDAAQKQAAEASKKKVAGILKANIETEITAASTFYAAEEYHQDYYKKNSVRYTYYRTGCGRDHRLEVLWGKKGDS